MYKNVDDYYTQEGKPIRCFICGNTSMHSEGDMEYCRIIGCIECGTPLGVQYREFGKKHTWAYTPGPRKEFILKYPQNEFLNTISTVIGEHNETDIRS